MPDVVSPERKELSKLRQAADALDIVTFNERKQEFFCRACRYRDPLGPDSNKLHDDDCPWLRFLNELEAAEADLARLRAQGTWQPIASYVEPDEPIPVVVWNGQPWIGYYEESEGWSADVDGEMLRIDPPPTLWLPAPPDTEGA